MNQDLFPFSTQARQFFLYSLGGLFYLLPLTEATAQTPERPAQSNATRPKNGCLMIIGYEMEKSRAEAILQSQDMSKDADPIVAKLEALAKANVITHASCALQNVRSGIRSAMDTGSVRLAIDPILSQSGDKLSVNMTRNDVSSGVSSAIKAMLNTEGGCFFIGSVPDVKPGVDQLLFMRCLIHYLE